METPIDSYNPDHAYGNPLILVCSDDTQIHRLPDIFADLIARGIYPLTKGVPFCNGDARHMVETFGKTRNSSDYPQCAGCAMATWCGYRGRGFTVKPIRDLDPDLKKWLDDENTVAFV